MAFRNENAATPESIKRNAETVLAQAVRIKQLEAMITGLIEAQNPLLEEWTKLKADYFVQNDENYWHYIGEL